MPSQAQRHRKLRHRARSVDKNERPVPTLALDALIESSAPQRAVNGGGSLRYRATRTPSETFFNRAGPSNIHRPQRRTEGLASNRSTKFHILCFWYVFWIRCSTYGLPPIPRWDILQSRRASNIPLFISVDTRFLCVHGGSDGSTHERHGDISRERSDTPQFGDGHELRERTLSASPFYEGASSSCLVQGARAPAPRSHVSRERTGSAFAVPLGSPQGP